MMVSVRAAKQKGAALEYSVQYSLSGIYLDIYRTSERGFQRQFDLCSDTHKVAVECKRLKSLSWAKAEEFFNKLCLVASEYKCYLIFKSNNQPCLVMYKNGGSNIITVVKFEDFFGVPFQKHPSTRIKKEVKP